MKNDQIWTPKTRYSAVAVFSKDLDRVVLIHKLRPDWQAGKANFPGGKVENEDWPGILAESKATVYDQIAAQHRRCAVRELAEETGLIVDEATLKPFCTLRFRSSDGNGECQFFAIMLPCHSAELGDYVSSKTDEMVFTEWADDILASGEANYRYRVEHGLKTHSLSTMSNLPWLVAMARQTLRGNSDAPSFVVYEAEAAQ